MSENSRMIFPCVMNCKRPVLGCTRAHVCHPHTKRNPEIRKKSRHIGAICVSQAECPRRDADGAAAQAPVSELGNVWANQAHGGVRMQIHARTSP